jgi:threonylcarbamoyladenosine tRNA methylthiotransferase MtaB
MNRPANTLENLTIMLENFRAAVPDGGIGGDFIVGFPGETDEQFEDTCAAVERIGFSYGHVFRYSKRPQTAAHDLPGQITEQTKNIRSERLRNVLENSRALFIRRCADIPQKILVEKENPISGLASNYLRIDVPEAFVPHNTWLNVILTPEGGTANWCSGVALKRAFT